MVQHHMTTRLKTWSQKCNLRFLYKYISRKYFIGSKNLDFIFTQCGSSSSSSSCFFLQKTVWAGETRAGRKGKQKRRGDILLFEFLHLLKRGCDQFLLFTFCIFNIRLLIFAFLIWIFISSIICSYFESHSCSGWRQNGDQELCLQVKGLLCIGKLQRLLMMMITIWCCCSGVRKMMMMMMIWLVNCNGWWWWWLSDVFVQESERWWWCWWSDW